ncbi:hypothetical protein [Dactylosporangium sp. CA-233914]|uniref:hypothetical protein n=1 Tax=Dactylosporangium sp. CA-233914 TaxID=3239934 RepID=UPI003D94432F
MDDAAFRPWRPRRRGDGAAEKRQALEGILGLPGEPAGPFGPGPFAASGGWDTLPGPFERLRVRPGDGFWLHDRLDWWVSLEHWQVSLRSERPGESPPWEVAVLARGVFRALTGRSPDGVPEPPPNPDPCDTDEHYGVRDRR